MGRSGAAGRVAWWLVPCCLVIPSLALGQARLRDRIADLARSQDPPQAASGSVCPSIVRAEAWLGTPLGVGMVSFRLPKDGTADLDPAMLIQTGAVQVGELAGRVLYPAVGQAPAARFFRGVFGPAEDPTDQLITTWFLFRGNEPLQLCVLGCEGITVPLVPRPARDNQHARMLNQWWREYQRLAAEQTDRGDYPDLIETYLTSMLAHRLGTGANRRNRSQGDPLQETLNLLMDAESIRSDLVRDWFAGSSETSVPNLPLPRPVEWTGVQVNGLPDDVAVEPIASVVPEDCFYLRFGTWDNQVWLKRLMNEHGGDLGRMVSLRGHRPRIESRFLNQLALESSQIDEWFGGRLIRDVAVIGRDTLFGSGPSVGVLLESSDPVALRRRIEGRRSAFKPEGTTSVQLATVEIEGEKVSFLSSPDNRYRSFHVVQGNFHLFTNSRAIASAFIQASRGGPSLGRSEEFRFARVGYPLDRNDTVFIYLPTGLFRNLLSPKHQIELLRRSEIVTEMQLLQLARSAASVEGYPEAPLEFLTGNGFLPPRFGQRPGGSTVQFDGEGWQDSLRGRLGFFLPVADMEEGPVTRREADWYAAKTRFFTESVRQLDPMLIAIRRFDGGENRERIVVDARIAPFGQKEFGWIDTMLGPPLKHYVVGPDNEVLRLQVSMRRSRPGPQGDTWQLFAAIQDAVAPGVEMTPESWLDLWRTAKQVPGYVGATPPAGLVDWMPRLGGMPDAEGFTFSRLLGLWRLQTGEFSALAFDPARLEPLKQNLRVVPAERAAQIRLSVADLSSTGVGNWLNVLNYRRAWQTSVANARLLNTLIGQFGVEPSLARDYAEELLDVRLVCAMGGEYRLAGTDDRPVWISTAWPSFRKPLMPEGYASPLLSWFRGMEVEINRVENHYELRGFADLQRTGQREGLALPGVELLKGFGDLLPGFGGRPGPSN